MRTNRVFSLSIIIHLIAFLRVLIINILDLTHCYEYSNNLDQLTIIHQAKLTHPFVTILYGMTSDPLYIKGIKKIKWYLSYFEAWIKVDK